MTATQSEAPYWPIIYVRGYAGSEEAVEETVATPYMGFNTGSTKVRQRWDKQIQRVIFESPLVRLMKDHGYRDVYEGGEESYLTERIDPRSVVIYRYYDRTSESFSDDPERPTIPVFAEGLADLIERIRDAVCGAMGEDNDEARAAFRVQLVAHSMGGLICRCLLQSAPLRDTPAARAVSKLFTYGTPHNGIELRLVGNIPGFFSRNNVNNFNREKMADYLDLEPDGSGRVDGLGGHFDTGRCFSLVGTNAGDYTVASGWSRRAVGPMSDGLVRIDNASIQGAPRAFVHRSHSGDYGLVNSEEGYQNLSRFLFGDVRVDGVLEVESLTLPPRVEKAKRDGKRIRASYHFETAVRVRGARYFLHRRMHDEGSAVLRSFDELLRPEPGHRPRHPHLFSVFLSSNARTKRGSGPLVFSVLVQVRVPEYEIDRVLWLDEHIEGSYLFQETLTLEASPPDDPGGEWTLRFGLDSRTPGRATRDAEATPDRREGTTYRIPLESRSRPGLSGQLALRARSTHEQWV